MRPPGPAVTRTALLLTTLLLLVATGGCAGDSPSTEDRGYVTGNGIITQLPQAQRKPVSGLAGRTLDGDTFDLADHRGSVVVVNVWGSWCPPCRVEAPRLADAARALDDGAVFVGINTKDSGTDQGKAFERRYDVPYPSLYDPQGRTLLAFRGTLPPTSIPSTVVVDERGRVAASILGEVPSSRTLVDLVEDVAG